MISEIKAVLPQFIKFVNKLAIQYQKGEIQSYSQLEELCEDFFTKKCHDDMEETIPYWKDMTKYGANIVHVVSTFIALLNLEEYKKLDQKNNYLIEWTVFIHDIAKERRRDPTHPFKSAALAAKVLNHLNMGTTNQYGEIIDDWYQLVINAYIGENSRLKQDNTKLSSIIAGIDKMFNEESRIILKSILFHQSVEGEKKWKRSAPLTQNQIKEFFNKNIISNLEILMLADSKSWNLFDNSLWKKYRSEIKTSLKLVREITR